LQRGQKWGHPLDHTRVMLPQMPGELATGEPCGVEIRGGRGVVTKGSSSVEDIAPTLQAGVEGNQVRVVLHKMEGTTDVVISHAQFLIRISNAEIAQPNQKLHFRGGKGKRGLIGLVSSIIDGKAPRVGAKAIIEDRCGLLKMDLRLTMPWGVW
jgi:hypothetical protein